LCVGVFSFLKKDPANFGKRRAQCCGSRDASNVTFLASGFFQFWVLLSGRMGAVGPVENPGKHCVKSGIVWGQRSELQNKTYIPCKAQNIKVDIYRYIYRYIEILVLNLCVFRHGRN
jgi:hypothetical protein